MPVNDKIYELLSCPSTQFKIETNVKLFQSGNLTQNWDISLFPGLPEKLGTLTLIATPLGHSPTPLFSRKFIYDGSGMALADDLINDLFCSDEQESKGFMNCTLSNEACYSCTPDHDKEIGKCSCRNTNFDDILSDPEKSFPITSGHQTLINSGRTILATTQYTPVKVMLKFTGLKLALQSDMATCKIDKSELIGCYNCHSGAEFRYLCTSDFGNQLAEIKCNDLIFVAHCMEDPVYQNISLTFDQPDISLNCSVTCNAGKTFFELKGSLYYIPMVVCKIQQQRREIERISCTIMDTVFFSNL